jgi:phosphatidylserine/phosphatidylglycerophosphate/cardiolipin synthase-like enzyme
MYLERKLLVFFVVILMVNSVSVYSRKPHIENLSSSPVEIFFSPPVDLNHKLTEYIDSAQESIKACFYGMRSEEVAYALIKAHLKGVKVQIVIDRGRLFAEDSFYPKLRNFGVARKDTIAKGLMHNKFCIIDEKIVWTGSYNPSNYSVYENNDAVVIQSKEIANIYTEEFKKLWDSRSIASEENNDRRIKVSGDTSIEVYFSPEDNLVALSRILEVLANAKNNICFAQFTITHPEIAKILIKKSKEGIAVKGIMEYEQIASYSKYPNFEIMNMNVRKDKNYSFAFHHKFFIIDENIVITGSLNPTKAGFGKNRENVLIIQSTEVARKYLEYFRDIP